MLEDLPARIAVLENLQEDWEFDFLSRRNYNHFFSSELNRLNKIVTNNDHHSDFKNRQQCREGNQGYN